MQALACIILYYFFPRKRKKKADGSSFSRVRDCLSRTEFEIVSAAGKK